MLKSVLLQSTVIHRCLAKSICWKWPKQQYQQQQMPDYYKWMELGAATGIMVRPDKLAIFQSVNDHFDLSYMPSYEQKENFKYGFKVWRVVSSEISGQIADITSNDVSPNGVSSNDVKILQVEQPMVDSVTCNKIPQKSCVYTLYGLVNCDMFIRQKSIAAVRHFISHRDIETNYHILNCSQERDALIGTMDPQMVMDGKPFILCESTSDWRDRRVRIFGSTLGQPFERLWMSKTLKIFRKDIQPLENLY